MFSPLLQTIAAIGSWGGLIALAATILCLQITLIFLYLYWRFERRQVDLLFAWMALCWALAAFCGWMLIVSDVHLTAAATVFWLRMEYMAAFIALAALIHFVGAFLGRSPLHLSVLLLYTVAAVCCMACFSPLFLQPPPREERFFALDRLAYVTYINEPPGSFLYWGLLGIWWTTAVLMSVKLWSTYRRVRERERGAIAHEIRLVVIGLLTTLGCGGIDSTFHALRVTIAALPLFHPIGEATLCVLTAVALIREMVRTALERRALEVEVQQAREVAERAIAGGMAHEIRNAVGGSVLVLSHLHDRELFPRSRAELAALYEQLKSQRERLKEGFPQMAQHLAVIASALEEAEGAVEMALNNDERAVAITNRVLDLSRIERELGGEAVEVNALVEEVVENARRSHPGVKFTVQREGEGVFWGNPDLLFAVVQNLVLNAVDAVQALGEGASQRVEVRSLLDPTPGRGGWTLAVADNGAGMNAEQQAHIFEPFYSTKGQRGTGLGLYLVRRVVSAYRGEIQAESGEGKGTTLTLYLPLTRERATPTVVRPGAPRPPLPAARPEGLNEPQSNSSSPTEMRASDGDRRDAPSQ